VGWGGGGGGHESIYLTYEYMHDLSLKASGLGLTALSLMLSLKP